MKYLFVDSKIRDEELEYFKELNYTIIPIITNSKIYNEISSHTDIHICNLGNDLIVSKEVYEYLDEEYFNNNKYLDLKDRLICGSNYVKDKYPNDIKYNVFKFKNFVFHNFKYTDETLLKYIDKNNYIKVNINQGYSNCSSLNIDDKIVITSNKEIFEFLKSKNEIVHYVSNEDSDIKLLIDKSTYSNMKGFIGGATSYINNTLIIFGDICNISEYEKLKDILNSNDIKYKYFENLSMIDYGKAIEINT